MSIYPGYLPSYAPAILPAESVKNFQTFIEPIIFFSKNLKLVCLALEKKTFAAFDGLTASHNCQSLTSKVVKICSTIDFSAIQQLKATAEKVRKAAENLKQSKTLPNKEISLQDFVNERGLNIQVNPEMDFLCKAHILAIACTITIPRQTDYQALKTKISPLSNSEDHIRRIREDFSYLLAHDIQQQAGELENSSLVDGVKLKQTIISIGNAQLDVLPTFYSFKTILLNAKKERLPIVISPARKTTQSPYYFVYRSQGLDQPFKLVDSLSALEGRPCFVVESLLAKDIDLPHSLATLSQHDDPLMDVLLANAALSPQFAKEDHLELFNETQKAEILHYRELGSTLGCTQTDLRLLSILHTSPGTIKSSEVYSLTQALAKVSL